MDAYQCSICGKVFGRQEHLRRHEQSHKAPEFRCYQCPKAFHRKDALNKHEQTHLVTGPSLLQRGVRACSACASMKSRCTGDVPCARCKSRGTQCVYPRGRRSATVDSVAASQTSGYHIHSNSSSQQVQSTEADQASGASAYPHESHPAQPDSNSAAALRAGDSSVLYPPNVESLVQQHFQYSQGSAIPDPLEQGIATPALDWTSNMVSTINWLQPESISFNDEDLNSLFPIFPGDYIFSPSIDFVSPEQGFDVEYPPNNPVSSIINQQPPAQSAHELFSHHKISPSTDLSTPADKPTVASGEYYVDGDVGRLPRSKRRKIASRPRSLEDADEPEFSLEYRFPIDSGAPSSEERLRLSDKAYGQLQALYQQLCLGTMIFRPFMPFMFPSKQAMEGLLTNYFANFDQTMPFLHSQTFSADSRHCILLLAMMAVGSCFADNNEQTETFTLSMHEFVRRVLILSEEQNYWRPSNPEVLAQTQLLHAVGAGYALYEPLRASAHRSLQEATRYCRNHWTRQKIAAARDRHDDDVGPSWEAWTRNEELLRTGFCIWLLDCMWAFQYQTPPHLRLDDAATMTLPCPDRLWAAEDGSEWNQIRAGVSTAVPTLLEALRNLYVDKRLLPNLGEFSRILLIHGLFHRTWEIKATATQSLSLFEPSAQKQTSHENQSKIPIWPPANPLFNRWRNSACDCLDILHWSANAMIGASSGMEHPTVLHLHLARIVLLVPLNDIILFSHYLIRSSKESSRLFPAVTSAEAEERRRSIQRWAIQDQYKARLAAIHAGVVFWHVRLYSVNGFYEPTAVAFAALMFWALSAFSPKKTTPAKGSRRGGGTSSSESSPSADVCDIILIDRPTDDELVQQFVRQGNNMRVNITGVGDLFGPKGARRVLMEGQKLLLTLGSWRGISNHWLRVLNRLEKVTAAADVNLAPAEENVSAG